MLYRKWGGLMLKNKFMLGNGDVHQIGSPRDVEFNTIQRADEYKMRIINMLFGTRIEFLETLYRFPSENDQTRFRELFRFLDDRASEELKAEDKWKFIRKWAVDSGCTFIKFNSAEFHALVADGTPCIYNFWVSSQPFEKRFSTDVGATVRFTDPIQLKGKRIHNGCQYTIDEHNDDGSVRISNVRTNEEFVLPIEKIRQKSVHPSVMTVFKAQGSTVDGKLMLMDAEHVNDLKWHRVALTRAKYLSNLIFVEGCDVYKGVMPILRDKADGYTASDKRAGFPKPAEPLDGKYLYSLIKKHNGRCAGCSLGLKYTEMVFDRKDPNLPHVKRNLQPMCTCCNSRKAVTEDRPMKLPTENLRF